MKKLIIIPLLFLYSCFNSSDLVLGSMGAYSSMPNAVYGEWVGAWENSRAKSYHLTIDSVNIEAVLKPGFHFKASSYLSFDSLYITSCGLYCRTVAEDEIFIEKAPFNIHWEISNDTLKLASTSYIQGVFVRSSPTQ